MPRAFRAQLTRFLLLAVLVQYPAASGGQQVFRGASDAVRVFVTVTDRDGRLVTTLARENFEVRDDGKPQPLTQYDNSPQPIRLILMLELRRATDRKRSSTGRRPSPLTRLVPTPSRVSA